MLHRVLYELVDTMNVCSACEWCVVMSIQVCCMGVLVCGNTMMSLYNTVGLLWCVYDIEGW